MNRLGFFGFVDDTGFKTTASGSNTRRRLSFSEDAQRAFYSEYFADNGLKVQVVTIPNGLFSSIFVAILRVSDTGLHNMSGLDLYLTRLFLEFNKQLTGVVNQLPAVYGNSGFPQLGTIAAEYNNTTGMESVINKKMASIRQRI